MPIREPRLDNIKGGLVLLVIFGHLIEPLLNSVPDMERVYNFIYLFHIPCFVFISGFVSRPDYPVRFVSLFKSIISPFLIFSIIYEIAEFISLGSFSDYIRSLAPNWILWFLLSLMLWRILAPWVLKMRFGIVLMLIISLSVSLMEINGYAFSLLRTLVFFPFYLVGAMLSGCRENLLRCQVKPWMYPAAASVLLMLFWANLPFERGLLYGALPFTHLEQANSVAMIQRLYYYPLALLAILAFGILASGIHLVNRIGNNSLYIYLLHGLVVKYALWPVIQQMPVREADMFYLTIVLTAALGVFLSCSLITKAVSLSINSINELLLKACDSQRKLM